MEFTWIVPQFLNKMDSTSVHFPFQWPDFILLCVWRLLHGIHIPHFLYPSIHLLTQDLALTSSAEVIRGLSGTLWSSDLDDLGQVFVSERPRKVIANTCMLGSDTELWTGRSTLRSPRTDAELLVFQKVKSIYSRSEHRKPRHQRLAMATTPSQFWTGRLEMKGLLRWRWEQSPVQNSLLK